MADIRNLDLNLLKTFAVLMDERNVSRAAERLSLTQPAVSSMLTRLRSSFDDPLFVRSQRGVVPTPRAIALAPQVEALLENVNKLMQPSVFVPSETQMTLSIAAIDYTLQAVVLPFLQLLRKEAPGIKVASHFIDDSQVLNQLEQGKLDIALMTPETVPQDLHARVLYQEHYVCVVHDGHKLAAKGRLSLDEFCALEHALVSYVGGAFSGPTDKALAELGRQRRVVLSVPSFLVLLEVLRSSELVAVVPKRLIQAGQGMTIMTLPKELKIEGFTKVMAWHERSHNHQAHRWIRELIVKAIKP